MGTRKMTSLYSKPATRKLWDNLLDSGIKLTTWCRRNRVNRQELVLSVQKWFPTEWDDKEHTLGPIPTDTCAHCGREFIVNVAGQKFCNSAEARKQWEVDNPDKATSARYKVTSGNATEDTKR